MTSTSVLVLLLTTGMASVKLSNTGNLNLPAVTQGVRIRSSMTDETRYVQKYVLIILFVQREAEASLGESKNEPRNESSNSSNFKEIMLPASCLVDGIKSTGRHVSQWESQ